MPSYGILRTWQGPTASSAAAFPTRAVGGPLPVTSVITPASSAITPGQRQLLTSQPMRPGRFRLTDRGLIRPGFVADIAVLDPAAVIDKSTYAAGRTRPPVSITCWSMGRSRWKTASRPGRLRGGRCGEVDRR